METESGSGAKGDDEGGRYLKDREDEDGKSDLHGRNLVLLKLS